MEKSVLGLAVLCLLFPATVWSDTVDLTPIGDVTTWPGTPYRWMDVADNPYSSDYQGDFTYGQPSVSLTYDDISTAFSGSLAATGLKPNFAYQMKLVGMPGIDDWTNEQIGYAGRWWRNAPNSGNTTDADYEANKDDPGYEFLGYLLFDFFVTDEQGAAAVTFGADSSFHVLWATEDSTTSNGTGHRDPGANDSAVRYYDFRASSGVNSPSYDTDYGSAHVGVYAEWESGRAMPGHLVLPAGEYNCQFILTEESFHQTGLGGGWAAAMGSDVQFTVVPAPPAVWLLGFGLIGLVGIRRRT
ncbi:MAG: VPLPA-CTERM sorting domain-containing protein [Thermodesulfobacteriota bacterium]|nr:VPLPA-CTERM sorting domain-containing protein [Thermodesulfobacteriota bacterium]